MAQYENVVPVFKNHTVKNETRSKAEGRPIYDDMEIVEVRYPGDRNKVGVFPAHAFCGWTVDDEGNQVEQTYATKWPAQYQRFKAKQVQVKEGTPIEELPFLTAAKRSELKGLNIYTAESLAMLDGNNLKSLGQGGRELKNQAQAYLDNATGSAVVTKQAAEIEALKEQVAMLLADRKAGVAAPPKDAEGALESMDDAQLKAFIKEKTGSAPRGQPSRETLLRDAAELERSA